MGNYCDCNNTVTNSEISDPKYNEISMAKRQTSYIDNQGKPLPDAYKRYIKAPTTVGRQSLVIRKLAQADQIPDWIWKDMDILQSDHNKQHNNLPLQLRNRNTYQQLTQNYKLEKTINVDKLNHQNQKNITQSHKVTSNTNLDNLKTTAHVPSYNLSGVVNYSSTYKSPQSIPIPNIPRSNSVNPQNIGIKRTDSTNSLLNNNINTAIQSTNLNTYPKNAQNQANSYISQSYKQPQVNNHISYQGYQGFKQKVQPSQYQYQNQFSGNYNNQPIQNINMASNYGSVNNSIQQGNFQYQKVGYY